MTNEELPPPLPTIPRPAPGRLGRRVGIATAVFGAIIILCFCALVALRVSGLIGAYKITNTAMAPAIKNGDNIMTEGVTYRFRRPRCGEVVIIKADELPHAKPGERYVKRLVGLPGDRLRISGGALFINDQPAPFRNKEGEVQYKTRLGQYLRNEDETFVVPDGRCFVLGDNSSNSADSRMWGAIPVDWVTGRAVCCYLPSENVGWIR